MLIKNISVLYGSDLKYLSSVDVRVSGQYFKQIRKSLRVASKEECYDCEGFLMIPGFVNAHTHIGDSLAKDLGLELGAEQRIHPISGLKQRILSTSKPSHLVDFMRNACVSMIRKGITTFVDFREGSIDGINLIQKAIRHVPIRPVILGRLEYYQDKRSVKQNIPLPKSKRTELQQLLRKCDGLGISGSNENSDSVLRYYSKFKKIKAIHSAETNQSCKTSKKLTNRTETHRCLLLRPNFLVHMTHASRRDLQLAAKNKISIVVCPRANASLAEGIPDVSLMIKAGCNVTIGTDNVMFNSPDMFRELDYLWKVSMGMKKSRIDPKTILKMATVNAGKLLRNKKLGMIQENTLADCIIMDKRTIDLAPMHNPYASIVHRASENAIKAVIIGGKIAHGTI